MNALVSRSSQGPADVPPVDAFQMTIDSPSKPKTSSKRSTPRKGHWLKAASTASRTLQLSDATAEIDEPLEILRFFAKWVDSTEGEADSGTKERQELYKIHFYLEDESIEIVVSNKKDLKYQLYPVLLNRQKATKSPMVSVGDIGTEKDYITLEDLAVGKVIAIQDRQMLVYKADGRTYR